MVYPDYVTIGAHTYSGEILFHRWGRERISIGKFRSISQGVKMLAGGNHRTDTVSTYPFDTMPLKNGQPERSYDLTGDGIEIGSDVWIGYGASILGSCKIGHGVVIAANATVFTDIPPYAIAVGNPARVTKFRFSDPIIEKRLDIAWWNWPEKMILDYADDFYLPVSQFTTKHIAEVAA